MDESGDIATQSLQACVKVKTSLSDYIGLCRTETGPSAVCIVGWGWRGVMKEQALTWNT